MENTTKDQNSTNQENAEAVNKTDRSMWIKEDSNTSPNEDNLLNLIAEIVVENIVKTLRNGRNRIHPDQ
nr:hypothetical protein [Pedobacter panaciterrae]